MDLDVENVLVYMPDSLRWDRRHAFLGDDGVAVKTAAHSTYTFTSVPSMLSGYLPHQHGVYSQRHKPMFDPADEGLFDIQGYNTYLKANQIIAEMFSDAADTVWRHIDESHDESHVDDLEPPFVYFEADSGGHSPYDDGKEHDSGWEFLYETADESRNAFTGYYDTSVENSAERLKNMIEELEDRGLRDNTLIMITSDHGEHLWEHGGLVGHLHPATHKLVHVPTVVRHPDLTGRDLPNFVQHVDLLPTVFDVVGADDPHERDGRSFLNEAYRPRPAVNLTRFHPAKLSSYGNPCLYFQESLWDADGGHVFNQLNLLQRAAFYVVDQFIERKAVGGKWQGFHPSSFRETLPLYLEGHREFGTPDFSKSTAERLLEEKEEITSEMEELDEATEDRLRELGYI